MARTKKEGDTEVTYTVSKDANKLTGTDNGKVRVYASKPKKTASKTPKDAKVETAKSDSGAGASDDLEKVIYELSDTDHPIEGIHSFVHATIYWIPNSKQFMIENAFRSEGKLIISAPTDLFTCDHADLNAVNAVLGMHFDEAFRGTFDVLRKGITQDTEHIRIFHICELGLIRDENKIQYTYLSY